ncbi:MAG: class I SAM-dependent methyltransferase [Oscillospiraceae bacterium]|nr:class I SAM-dependent methyltransferase [Oscillospiraceae bacterium]
MQGALRLARSNYPICCIVIMKHVKLSKRLQAIADLIDDGASVADIGTNHGLLPIYLAQTGTAKKIIAADISPASLNAARLNVCQTTLDLNTAPKSNMTSTITFLVTPGLNGIDPEEIDTIIIAGMGAETIVDILDNASWIKEQKTKLILQPQSKIYILFRFLYNNGHKIREIKYVQDRGKRYVVVLV